MGTVCRVIAAMLFAYLSQVYAELTASQMQTPKVKLEVVE